MKKPFVIIITGPQCAGKTTLGRRLSELFGVPVLNKNTIREILYTHVRAFQRHDTKRLGPTTFAFFYYILALFMEARQSCIVESNFIPEIDNEKFLAIKNNHPFSPIQLYCSAPLPILMERFRKRASSKGRHPCHFDKWATQNIPEHYRTRVHGPLKVGGTLIKVDTTDFDSNNYKNLPARLSRIIKRPVQRTS